MAIVYSVQVDWINCRANKMRYKVMNGEEFIKGGFTTLKAARQYASSKTKHEMMMESI